MSHIKSIRVETKSQKSERLRDEWIAEAVGHLYSLRVFVPGDEGAAWNAVEVAGLCFDSLLDEDGGFDFNLYQPKESINEELTYW